MKKNSFISKEVPFTPYDLQWFPCSALVCAVGSTKRGNGHIGIYQLSNGQLELKSETSTKATLRCVATAGEQRYIVTGDFDGRIQFWDTYDLKQPISTVKGHDSIINCIDSLDRPGEPIEVVTGSRDGSIKVWDMRQPDQALLVIHSKSNSSDIWAVAFGWVDQHKMIAVGYENGTIQLFDVDGAQFIWSIQVEGGVCSLDFDKNHLLVSTVSGACVVEMKTSSIKYLQTAQNTTVWKIKRLDDGRFVTSGGDGALSAYNLHKSLKPDCVLNLSKHPITTLALNKDKPELFVCGAFDNTIRVGIL